MCPRPCVRKWRLPRMQSHEDWVRSELDSLRKYVRATRTHARTQSGSKREKAARDCEESKRLLCRGRRADPRSRSPRIPHGAHLNPPRGRRRARVQSGRQRGQPDARRSTLDVRRPCVARRRCRRKGSSKQRQRQLWSRPAAATTTLGPFTVGPSDSRKGKQKKKVLAISSACHAGTAAQPDARRGSRCMHGCTHGGIRDALCAGRARAALRRGAWQDVLARVRDGAAAEKRPP